MADKNEILAEHIYELINAIDPELISEANPLYDLLAQAAQADPETVFYINLRALTSIEHWFESADTADFMGEDLFDVVEGKIITADMELMDPALFEILAQNPDFLYETDSGVLALDAMTLAEYSIGEFKAISGIGEKSLKEIRAALQRLAAIPEEETLSKVLPLIDDETRQRLAGKWVSFGNEPMQIMNTELQKKLVSSKTLDEMDHYTVDEESGVVFVIFDATALAQKSESWFLNEGFAPGEIDQIVAVLEGLASSQVEGVIPKAYRPFHSNPESIYLEKVHSESDVLGGLDTRVFNKVMMFLGVYNKGYTDKDHQGFFFNAGVIAEMSPKTLQAKASLAGIRNKFTERDVRFIADYFERVFKA